MPYKIASDTQYDKKAAKFLKKHPGIQKKYDKAIAMLELDPFHPGLRLHKLTGRLEGLHAVSIDLQYRITLELLIVDETVILLDIGGHDGVYR